MGRLLPRDVWSRAECAAARAGRMLAAIASLTSCDGADVAIGQSATGHGECGEACEDGSTPWSEELCALLEQVTLSTPMALLPDADIALEDPDTPSTLGVDPGVPWQVSVVLTNTATSDFEGRVGAHFGCEHSGNRVWTPHEVWVEPLAAGATATVEVTLQATEGGSTCTWRVMAEGAELWTERGCPSSPRRTVRFVLEGAP